MHLITPALPDALASEPVPLVTLISHYVKRGSIDVVDDFNNFSPLASIESLFGLPRLGYAGIPGLPVFGLGVYNAYAG